MRWLYTTPTLLAALVLAAAGCSGNQTPGEEPGAGPPGEEAQIAHAQCMRDHGFEWPDPIYVDGGWDLRLEVEIDMESPAFIEAEAECEQVRRQAEQREQPDEGDPGDQASLEEEMERMLQFAACMREQGLEFPDPQFDDGGISGPAGPMDGDWEAFDAAADACGGQIDEPTP